MIERVELDVTAEGKKSQADVEIKETDGCLEGDFLFCLFLCGCWIRLKKKPEGADRRSAVLPLLLCLFVDLKDSHSAVKHTQTRSTSPATVIPTSLQAIWAPVKSPLMLLQRLNTVFIPQNNKSDVYFQH